MAIKESVNYQETLQFGHHVVEINRRPYQKRLGVSVYPNGEIRVSANRRLSQRQILKFLESQKQWIEKSLEESVLLQRKYPAKHFQSGELYPYLGEDYRLKIVQAERVSLEFKGFDVCFSIPEEETTLTVEDRSRYLQLFKQSYRGVAEKLMTQRLQLFSHEMSLYPSALQFRGQKTIWGSCSPENKISLNFKLIVAPLRVIDYVIIHELAHIRHKNHSKKFWNLVERYTGDRRYSRQWLREHQYKADFLAKKSELR